MVLLRLEAFYGGGYDFMVDFGWHVNLCLDSLICNTGCFPHATLVESLKPAADHLDNGIIAVTVGRRG
jgi:hypothetical protein